MLRSFVFLALAVVAATGAVAKPRGAEPWPELKKLEYFTGDWYEEAVVRPGPYGAGGKVTQTDHREWMEGKFFIVIHSTWTGLRDAGIGIEFIGYDPNAKVYTYDEFYSQGEAVHSRARVEGDTWIWDMGVVKQGAKMVHARQTFTIVSPTFYTTKFETSSDGGTTWTIDMEGTARKK
jgi:hypothetical protein